MQKEDRDIVYELAIAGDGVILIKNPVVNRVSFVDKTFEISNLNFIRDMFKIIELEEVLSNTTNTLNHHC